jgi:hypothetical protein
MRKCLAALGVALLMSGCSPNTYEDCILENMKGVSNSFAVAEVKQSCRVKFPAGAPEDTTIDLSADQLKKLEIISHNVVDIGGGFNGEGVYGTVYNGSNEVRILELAIKIVPTDRPYKEAQVGSKIYKYKTNIEPKSEGAFSLKMARPCKDCALQLVGAIGERL